MSHGPDAPRHLHTLDGYTREQLERLLSKAEELRDQKALTILRGKAVVLLFLNPSLRTRVSMELAARQLGADVVTLEAGAGLWKMEYAEGAIMRGDSVEHVKEAVRVLARYGDLLGVRAFPQRKSWEEDARDPVFSAFMRYSTVPVINLESCLYHPCQSLADLLTIRQFSEGAKSGVQAAGGSGAKPGKILLTWADHPRALPVAVPNSFALAVTQMGWDLTIARPPGYDLPPQVMEICGKYAQRSGGRLEVTDNRDAAFSDARFVYAKSWGSLDYYGLDAEEIEHRKKSGLSRWCVDSHAMARTDDAYFMHCLPVRRNVVVTDEVIDGSRSIVADQAENRLHVQKAILTDLFGVGT